MAVRSGVSQQLPEFLRRFGRLDLTQQDGHLASLHSSRRLITTDYTKTFSPSSPKKTNNNKKKHPGFRYFYLERCLMLWENDSSFQTSFSCDTLNRFWLWNSLMVLETHRLVYHEVSASNLFSVPFWAPCGRASMPTLPRLGHKVLWNLQSCNPKPHRRCINVARVSILSKLDIKKRKTSIEFKTRNKSVLFSSQIRF